MKRTLLFCFIGLLCIGAVPYTSMAATNTFPIVNTTNNNFTMLYPEIPNGGTVGGSNDVTFTWDGTKKTSVAIGCDYGGENQIPNATISSPCKVWSANWTAHDVAIYGPGTYTVYPACPAGMPGCGDVLCIAHSTNCPYADHDVILNPITFTVGPGELGVHLLFDWLSERNVDVVNVWQPKAVFGPSPMCRQGKCGVGPTCGDNSASKVWDWMSKDWDGDGINGAGMIDGSFRGFVVNFNVMGCPPTKIGAVRGNTWFLDMDGNGAWNEPPDVRISWGAPTDVPVTGDWNGDGKTKIGVFRANANAWFLDKNGNGVWDQNVDATYSFGALGDIPVTGDWNGDGKTEIGVVRGNTWFLDMDGNGAWNEPSDVRISWGAPTDVPVTGDWNGDGKTKIGVFRNGAWYIDYNGNGVWDAADKSFFFGTADDIPVSGDWDGSGTIKIGVFRGNGEWWLDYNGNFAWDGGGDKFYNFGVLGDKPVTGKW